LNANYANLRKDKFLKITNDFMGTSKNNCLSFLAAPSGKAERLRKQEFPE
jgi:hypothetical protein